jgi:hypothetical protein
MCVNLYVCGVGLVGFAHEQEMEPNGPRDQGGVASQRSE